MAINSNNVTREELQAHLDPMKDDIAEIKYDVKSLLAAKAGANAVWKAITIAAAVIGGFNFFH